MFLSNQ